MANATAAQLATVLAENRASLRRLACALVGEGGADDLVQETLEATWQRPPADDRPLRPWLRAVLVNRARMWVRSRGRREQRELAAETAAAPESPEASVARVELQQRVASAVLAVSEPYRQALIWRYVDDLSAEEIARRLDVPSATIRSRLRRGLDQVRAELDRGEPDGGSARWRLALAPLAAPVATPIAATTLVTGGLMLKLAVAVAAASAALVLLVVQRGEPAGSSLVPATPPVAAATAAAPAATASRPDEGGGTVRRFASPEERARLGAAIARARAGDAPDDTTEARTYDFAGGSVPRGATATEPSRPPGDLDKDYIRGRIQDVIPLVAECYELALERSPGLAGTLSVEFVIDAEEEIGGYVSEARVAEGSELADPELGECVTETILSVEFVAPEGGGTVRVTYPFGFRPAEPDAE